MKTLLALRTAKLECWRDKFNGILAAASDRQWRVQLVEGLPTNARLSKLIDFWKPCGIIAECSGVNRVPTYSTGLPIVFLDLDPSALPASPRQRFVRHDPVAIANEAAQELLSVQSETGSLAHFAFVGWFRTACWCEDKRRAFAQAIALHGRGVGEFAPRASDERDPAACQRRLAAWLASIPKPCGLFAVNDVMAENVLASAHTLGLSLPDELAVIGVDDDTGICEHASPTLSSVRPDFIGSGRVSVEILERLIAGRAASTPQLTTIPPLGVVRRQSTRDTEPFDPAVSHALERIRRDACAGLSAKAVLSDFGCSRRLAEMRFRRATGHGVLAEIIRVRLEAAQRLLAYPGVTVGAVANRCGWNSPAIFRRHYRKAFGHTPLQPGIQGTIRGRDCLNRVER